MRAGVGGLVEDDDSVLEIFLECSLERGGPSGNGRVVSGEDVHLVIIFEQQRPLLRLDLRALLRWFNHMLLLNEFLLDYRLLLHQLSLFFVRTHC